MKLTEEQHRAVEAAQGKPVDVLDPQTQRTYVLVAAELYQRMRQFIDKEGTRQGSQAAPFPAEGAAFLPPPGQPLRLKLRALPTPPEVAEELKKHCQRLGLWRRKYAQQAEDTLKLQYYFGGQAVAYLPTKDGPVIVAAGEQYSEAYVQLFAFLTPEERQQAIRDFPSRWNDTTNEVLTPFLDED